MGPPSVLDREACTPRKRVNPSRIGKKVQVRKICPPKKRGLGNDHEKRPHLLKKSMGTSRDTVFGRGPMQDSGRKAFSDGKEKVVRSLPKAVSGSFEERKKKKRKTKVNEDQPFEGGG